MYSGFAVYDISLFYFIKWKSKRKRYMITETFFFHFVMQNSFWFASQKFFPPNMSNFLSYITGFAVYNISLFLYKQKDTFYMINEIFFFHFVMQNPFWISGQKFFPPIMSNFLSCITVFAVYDISLFIYKKEKRKIHSAWYIAHTLLIFLSC
jgi:uncharacterized membrane protein